MRITKLEHACVMLEESGRRCYVDPGKFTTPITETAQVDVVVITHEHDDHWTPEQLSRIVEGSPKLTVLTTAGTAALIAEAEIEGLNNVVVGQPGETYEIGEFSIACFGGRHAEIHHTLPPMDNLGIVVNEKFAYAGDGYDLPPAGVAALALPMYGPWMRMTDSLNLLEQVRPKHVFPVHEMLLAKAGKEVVGSRFIEVADLVDAHYHDIAPYDSFEV